ncbi:MAG: hypothetical protein R3E90_09285 [Marinicella sp.]|nr:hypothetical protein [Xanthomonadales bacterium]
MKQSTVKNIYLLTFLLALLTPAIGSFKQLSGVISNQERRTLSAMPNIPKNQQQIKLWPKRFDAYFKDNFAFRDVLLNGFYRLKYVLRDASGTDVIYGKEPGWLFYNEPSSDPIGDYRNVNRFSNEQLAQFVANLQLKQQWLKKKGVEYLYVLAPSKHEIYAEYLPDYIQPINQINFKTQLKEELAKHPEINYLDLTDAIIKAKKTHLLYFKGDTHWNYYAGNLAQYEITKTINKLLPEKQLAPKLWPLNAFKFQWGHQGDLASILRIGPYFEEPLDKPDFDVCANVDYMLSLSSNSKYSTHCPNNSINALVFHDSFFNLIQPYLSSQFGKVQFIKKTFDLKETTQYLSSKSVDIVIEQRVDRFLPQ